MRGTDGSAGDADYGAIGRDYAAYRQPEPAIADAISLALGDARRVLNVGAGAGSYEPTDRTVTAVEPSASMRRQRPSHLVPAVEAVAERLPFEDGRFDAAMATFTIHQWHDVEQGLAEMRRVTRGPIVLLTCDPARVARFWLNTYAPAVLATETRRYPALGRIVEALGAGTRASPVAIPLHCRDGFNEAYYGRPERFLDPRARTACSAWSFVDDASVSASIDVLRDDLGTGAWDRRYGPLRDQATYDGSLVLVVSPGA